MSQKIYIDYSVEPWWGAMEVLAVSHPAFALQASLSLEAVEHGPGGPRSCNRLGKDIAAVF